MNYRKLSDNSKCTYEEKIILNEICENYGLKFLTATKVRSAYKVKLKDSKEICVKKMKNGRKKVLLSYKLVEDLRKKGFLNTPRYLKTTNEHVYVKYKNMIFFATEWINGVECDLSNINEACEAAKLMAEFHKSTELLNIEKYNIKSNIKNWPKIFVNNLNDFERFESAISKKRLINEFDNMFLENIDEFYYRGLKALNTLNSSQYHKISREYSSKKTICHNSFYYQNIIKKDKEFYLIDMNSIIIDLRFNDLGKFIQRLMYKKEYKWEFNSAKAIIESYNSIYKLSKNELEIMLAFIIFPHKFWKLGKKRYINNKNWSEDKYIHKLNKIIKYAQYQDSFINEYINFLIDYH